jgi:hypothetical protein
MKQEQRNRGHFDFVVSIFANSGNERAKCRAKIRRWRLLWNTKSELALLLLIMTKSFIVAANEARTMQIGAILTLSRPFLQIGAMMALNSLPRSDGEGYPETH